MIPVMTKNGCMIGPHTGVGDDFVQRDINHQACCSADYKTKHSQRNGAKYIEPGDNQSIVVLRWKMIQGMTSGDRQWYGSRVLRYRCPLGYCEWLWPGR